MHNYIPVRHGMMHQTNDCPSLWVMQHKALGPAALGLGRPGALPAGLVQTCPKPRALIHKQTVNQRAVMLDSAIYTNNDMQIVTENHSFSIDGTI